jgi:hypothetical protein
MIDRKLFGPRNWREYPVFWFEGIKFKLEMFVSKHF